MSDQVKIARTVKEIWDDYEKTLYAPTGGLREGEEKQIKLAFYTAFGAALGQIVARWRQQPPDQEEAREFLANCHAEVDGVIEELTGIEPL